MADSGNAHGNAAMPLVEWIQFAPGGFFDGARFDFVSGLNADIGGQGSGKTTVLEAARWTLGTDPPPWRSERVEGLLERNLGPGGAKLGLLTTEGQRYVVERLKDGKPEVRDEHGAPAELGLDGELFSIEMWSQGEVHLLAEQKTTDLLSLVDAFAKPEFKRFAERRAELTARIHANFGRRRVLAGEILELRERAAELPTAREALAALVAQSRANDDEEAQRILAERALRVREQAWLAGCAGDLREATAVADVLAKASARLRSRPVEPAIAAGPNAELFARVHAVSARGADAIDAAGRAMFDALKLSERELAEVAAILSGAHAAAETVYSAWALAREGDRERLARRDFLEKHIVELEAVQRAADDRQREHDALADEYARLAALLAALTGQRSDRREAIRDHVNDVLRDTVRVEIGRGKGRAAYLALLQAILGNAVTAPYIKRLAEFMPPEPLLRAIAAKDTDAFLKLDNFKTDKQERAERVLEKFSRSERLHEIATADIDDVATIDVLLPEGPRAFHTLSDGERGISILVLAMFTSNAPLLLDQPDEHVDTKAIVNVFLSALEIVRRRRQIIINTKDANIVVNGRADHVNVTESVEGRGVLVAKGRYDRLVGHAEVVLEGGAAAFLARYACYHPRPKRRSLRRRARRSRLIRRLSSRA